MKHQNLLLATDFSARSDRPTARALMLKEQLALPLLVLHVPGERRLNEEDEAELERWTRSEFELQNNDADMLFRYGSVPSVVAQVAEERCSKLIITGVARFNSPTDFVLGTAVDYLVRRSPVPVLVVKRRPHRPYGRLLVTTDFSDCSVQALLAAAELFPDATLRVVNAFHAAYEGFLDRSSTVDCIRDERTVHMNELLDKLPEEVRNRTESAVSEGDFHQAIFQEISRWNADLLVVGSHGASGFAQATIGSKAADLLSYAPSDVLVVRERS